MAALDIFALNERKRVMDRNVALLTPALTYTVTLGCTEGIGLWNCEHVSQAGLMWSRERGHFRGKNTILHNKLSAHEALSPALQSPE